MSFNMDDAVIGGQLKIGTGIAPAVGEGPLKMNGSAMVEGPVVIGQPSHFPTPYATLNVAPLVNSDAVPPFTPGGLPLGLSNPYSLCCSTMLPSWATLMLTLTFRQD